MNLNELLPYFVSVFGSGMEDDTQLELLLDHQVFQKLKVLGNEPNKYISSYPAKLSLLI